MEDAYVNADLIHYLSMGGNQVTRRVMVSEFHALIDGFDQYSSYRT